MLIEEMLVEELMANYSPVGDIISFVCTGVLLFLIAKVLNYAKDKKFIYMEKGLHCILIASSTNAVFYYTLFLTDNVIFIYLLRDVYHLSLLGCLYYFICYMKYMLDVKGGFARFATYFTRILLGAAVVFDVISPLTGFGLVYKNGEWQDPVISPYTIFYAYAILVFVVMLTFYGERMIKPLRICLVAAEIVVVAIMIFQAVYNINSYTTFTYLIPILVVMILLHSKPFDDKTGALSSGCFESFIGRNINKGIHMDYMVLELKLNVLDKMPDELGKALNSFWHKHLRHAFLFDLEQNLFLLAIPRDRANKESERKIVELTGESFQKQYMKYQIPYKVIGLFDIDFVENEADITGIIKYILMGMAENSIELVEEKKREELRLFKTIRENLADIERKADLNDERVLVYCQPIKNMRTGQFDTGEALMRMSIPEKGFLAPYLFIPIAEQYGYIHSLTKIMLNKVCREIKRLEEEGYYFQRISVNFAASEIKEESFCEEILSIVEKNGVDPSKIGIELTETQNENDFKIVKERISSLRQAGMTVYLDDVGTGYSNIDRIVKYEVDVVKFDRFFLLEAEKDPRVVKMLLHLSKAFRDLNYKLLFEGVETEEHKDLCELCEADYIQGFMYSKPLPIDEVRDFFDKMK